MVVESIGATSLLRHRPVFGLHYSKDTGGRRKVVNIVRIPRTEFNGQRLVCSTSRGVGAARPLTRMAPVKSQAMGLAQEAYSYKDEERLPRNFNIGTDSGVDRKPGMWPPENKADNAALQNPLLRQERMGCGWLGAIFEWEGVLIEENPDLEKQAWLALSQEEGKSPPPTFITRRIEGMKNEQAISEVLCWSRDPSQLKRMASRKEKIYKALQGGIYRFYTCNMCMKQMPWIYCSPGFVFCVCLKCAMFQVDYFISRKIKHQSHTQHQLALIQRPSSFKCDACNMEDSTKDMSYNCVDCPFWMHKSCADAPTSFLFHFHEKHPLMLSFSLPRVYHKFEQHCRLCNGKLGELNWLYYCSKCRYFAHFQCARSRQMLSSSENEEYPELVHLPVATESSVNLLFEQFIKEMSGPKNEEGCSTRGRLKDWAHVEHPLQLVTVDELNDEKDVLLICDGCAKPIRDDGHVFYACVPCKYFLHKFCGELPTRAAIDHQIIPSDKLFLCDCCHYLGNGISFFGDLPRNLWFRVFGPLKQHIACSALPKMIKHDSHPHPLHFNSHYTIYCKACGERFISRHGCEGCDFHLCAGCIMKPSRVKHRWDPHPLRLIFDPGMVEDHEHEFQCEYCSRDLDTNLWFYHCDDCDLSFHLRCYDKSCYLHLSHVKFGATDITKDHLHHHSLTLVLNKKFRRCGECDQANIGEPVLECAPCKTIFCKPCSGMQYSYAVLGF
ncbi:hypothetical protein ACET3Z_004460 [Daucus carota]